MKPRFSTLWANYPHAKDWSRRRLYTEMGWEEFVDKPGFRNTCAIRTSYALQKSGVSVSSSAGMRALKGAVKDKYIEIRQDRLSLQLKEKWGAAEEFTGSEADGKIGDRNGVVSFWEIPGYDVGGGLGGHIDVIDGVTEIKKYFLYLFPYMSDEPSVCGSHCYFDAARVWFWELT